MLAGAFLILPANAADVTLTASDTANAATSSFNGISCRARRSFGDLGPYPISFLKPGLPPIGSLARK